MPRSLFLAAGRPCRLELQREPGQVRGSGPTGTLSNEVSTTSHSAGRRWPHRRRRGRHLSSGRPVDLHQAERQGRAARGTLSRETCRARRGHRHRSGPARRMGPSGSGSSPRTPSRLRERSRAGCSRQRLCLGKHMGKNDPWNLADAARPVHGRARTNARHTSSGSDSDPRELGAFRVDQTRHSLRGQGSRRRRAVQGAQISRCSRGRPWVARARRTNCTRVLRKHAWREAGGSRTAGLDGARVTCTKDVSSPARHRQESQHPRMCERISWAGG